MTTPETLALPVDQEVIRYLTEAGCTLTPYPPGPGPADHLRVCAPSHGCALIGPMSALTTAPNAHTDPTPYGVEEAVPLWSPRAPRCRTMPRNTPDAAAWTLAAIRTACTPEA